MHSSTQNTHANLPKQEGCPVVYPSLVHLLLFVAFFLKSLLQSCFIIILFLSPHYICTVLASGVIVCSLLRGKSHALKINGYVDISPGKQPSMTSRWSFEPCAMVLGAQKAGALNSKVYAPILEVEFAHLFFALSLEENWVRVASRALVLVFPYSSESAAAPASFELKCR